MHVLLDTHALIWHVEVAPLIKDEALVAISEAQNGRSLFVSRSQLEKLVWQPESTTNFYARISSVCTQTFGFAREYAASVHG